jgi:hypothetical protein
LSAICSSPEEAQAYKILGPSSENSPAPAWGWSSSDPAKEAGTSPSEERTQNYDYSINGFLLSGIKTEEMGRKREEMGPGRGWILNLYLCPRLGVCTAMDTVEYTKWDSGPEEAPKGMSNGTALLAPSILVCGV